ncbi:nuclear RNA export factor 2 [Culicoides brevitarsis]|uniref:nuclear RNA export factor 2 n=1 Tax=Culicoides brevitarsis TaxID=469753 RepID=UPI00307B3AC5
MFGGFNQQQNFNAQKGHTSNASNLVAVVGGSAGAPIAIANNPNSVPAAVGKKKRKYRLPKKVRQKLKQAKIAGTVRPVEQNMPQNPANRVNLPFEHPNVSRNLNQNVPSPMLEGQMKPNLLQQERIPVNFNFIALPKVIHMNVGTTIYLDTFSKKIYEPGKTDFDRQLMKSCDSWHQFVIHHNGKFTKKEILAALFTLIPRDEIFPIGYRQYDLHDVFLLTSSDSAGIETLFKNNLKLQIRDTEVCISVQLGAAKICHGQVHPKAQIILVCSELLQNATLHGSNYCVNLEGFEKNPAFSEVCISFANKTHLVTVFKALIDHEQSKFIKGMKFVNCGLRNLDSFRYLERFPKLEYLDLRNNHLESFIELKHLEKLNLTHLDVAGNPFVEKDEITMLQERIKRMLPTLKILDGLELLIRPKLEPGLLPGDDMTLDIMLDGDQITANDDFNAVNAVFKQRYRNSSYWHRVTVFHQGQYSKKQVVSKLLALVENNDLWPCYYSTMETYDEFYVHNNFEALEILVRNKLFIKSTMNEAPLQLMLTMNVSPYKIGQVDVLEKIQRTCLESLNNKILNLSGLADREIFSNVVIDMSSPRVVSQIILFASRKVSTHCTGINLSNNGITSCAGMFPLCWFPKLEYLNLRNNQIETFERLCGIPQPCKVSQVILEGNPLCNCSLFAYIKNAKQYFPELKTLDGASVTSDRILLGRQNYLCKPEAYSFVEAFVQHYFTLYDSNQKDLLKELYLDKAIFTLSCNFDVNRSKEVSRMSKYTSKARNIIRLVNLDQSMRNVFVGPDEIIKTIIDLHSTEHNFLTFCIDCPIHTKNFSVITVDGIFKDKPMQFLEDEFFIHFTRTFTLRSCGNGMGVCGVSQQFKIQNDLLLVRNVSTLEKISAVEEMPRDDEMNEEMKESEKENLIVVFQKMTSLNRKWCTRFLEDANWNFKLGLTLFVKLLEDSKIPENAFVKF